MFASPGSEYLRLIGEVAYAVSSMEWMIIGDLHRLATSLEASKLAGKTTGAIARELTKASASEGNAKVSDYLRVSADCLSDAASIRNSVLHARPATTPNGEQRLYRWTTDQPHGSQGYFIDDDWFTASLEKLSVLKTMMNDARPPFG